MRSCPHRCLPIGGGAASGFGALGKPEYEHWYLSWSRFGGGVHGLRLGPRVPQVHQYRPRSLTLIDVCFARDIATFLGVDSRFRPGDGPVHAPAVLCGTGTHSLIDVYSPDYRGLFLESS